MPPEYHVQDVYEYDQHLNMRVFEGISWQEILISNFKNSVFQFISTYHCDYEFLKSWEFRA